MFKDIKRIISLLNYKQIQRAKYLLVLMICTGIFELISIISIFPLISLISNPNIIYEKPALFYIYNLLSFNSLKDFIIFSGFFCLVAFSISIGIKILTNYKQILFLQDCEFELARKLFTIYINQPYKWILNRNSAILGKNILSEVNTVVNYGLQPILVVVSQSIISSLILILIFVSNFKLAILLLTFFSITYAIIFLIFNPFLKRMGEERSITNSKRFKLLNETFGAFKIIKLLGLENDYLKKYNPIAKKYASRESYLQIITILPRYFIELLAFGGVQIIIIFKVMNDNDFINSLPFITLYLFSGYRLLPSLQQIYNSIAQLRYVQIPLRNIYKEVKKRKIDKYSFTNSSEIFNLKNKLTLENLSYSYQSSSKLVVNKINITIPAKTTIGLVGTTGSGKTTTIDIILGLLQPREGYLKVDDKIITPKNCNSWQKNIGYVPQEIFLSDSDICSNIAFGINKLDIDMDKVIKASKVANLHNFISKELPEGYKTKIGERGIRLSGGQKQRIGIARALYNNPTILILDEATSSLDNLTEKAVMEAVSGLSHEITIIMVAHRLSTVKKCDLIYLFENGEIAGKGNFEELKSSYKKFRDMANT
tara:strand:- start:204 stop:1994 length:1791 start_codon:yes stop_codon:yes gene_type:complete